MRLSLSLLPTLALIGLGNQATAQVATSAAEPIHCPKNMNFISSHRLCATDMDAMGPFSAEMIARCVRFGGGTEACSGATWSLDFAKSIRGTAQCQPGSTFSASLQDCTDGTNAYGPFTQARFEKCVSLGGGSACESSRWNQAFATKTLSPISNPPPVATPKPMPVPGTTLNVPYFYQHNNAFDPGRTCNLTSVAMVLGYYGKNITPDDLFNRVGGPVFTGPDMAAIARDFGFRATFSDVASRETIKKHIDEGKPVILQGWFTKPGHIFVIMGYDKTGWVVNDPSGKWDQCFMCGYPNKTSTNGKRVHYSYADVEDAATDPGVLSSYWITVISK